MTNISENKIEIPFFVGNFLLKEIRRKYVSLTGNAWNPCPGHHPSPYVGYFKKITSKTGEEATFVYVSELTKTQIEKYLRSDLSVKEIIIEALKAQNGGSKQLDVVPENLAPHMLPYTYLDFSGNLSIGQLGGLYELFWVNSNQAELKKKENLTITQTFKATTNRVNAIVSYISGREMPFEEYLKDVVNNIADSEEVAKDEITAYLGIINSSENENRVTASYTVYLSGRVGVKFGRAVFFDNKVELEIQEMGINDEQTFQLFKGDLEPIIGTTGDERKYNSIINLKSAYNAEQATIYLPVGRNQIRKHSTQIEIMGTFAGIDSNAMNPVSGKIIFKSTHKLIDELSKIEINTKTYQSQFYQLSSKRQIIHETNFVSPNARGEFNDGIQNLVGDWQISTLMGSSLYIGKLKIAADLKVSLSFNTLTFFYGYPHRVHNNHKIIAFTLKTFEGKHNIFQMIIEVNQDSDKQNSYAGKFLSESDGFPFVGNLLINKVDKGAEVGCLQIDIREPNGFIEFTKINEKYSEIKRGGESENKKYRDMRIQYEGHNSLSLQRTQRVFLEGNYMLLYLDPYHSSENTTYFTINYLKIDRRGNLEMTTPGRNEKYYGNYYLETNVGALNLHLISGSDRRRVIKKVFTINVDKMYEGLYLTTARKNNYALCGREFMICLDEVNGGNGNSEDTLITPITIEQKRLKNVLIKEECQNDDEKTLLRELENIPEKVRKYLIDSVGVMLKSDMKHNYFFGNLLETNALQSSSFTIEDYKILIKKYFEDGDIKRGLEKIQEAVKIHGTEIWGKVFEVLNNRNS